MENKILIFGIILLMAGLVLAISGATFNKVGASYRWTGFSTTIDTIEGGNITKGDVGGQALTDRWAAYFGNVSGSIILGNGTGSLFVYTWNVPNASAAGEVCASTGSAYAFASVVAETAADVNTAFNMGSAADNATKTFLTDSGSCNLIFDVSSVPTSAYAKHTHGTFWTCAINNGTNTTTKDEMAFCTNISSSGANYNLTSVQYEILVPTEPGTGNETYYFYLELN